ncbi:MAG: HGxxPAAW family protein [Actinomycetales bacterium]
MTSTQRTEPDSITEPGHGNSVAAWTGVVIILIGALVSSLAVVAASTVGFIIGAVIIVLGVVAWKVLGVMGYGEKPHGH